MHKVTPNREHVEPALPERRTYPDKLFYKIGEVSKIAGVEPYVLRYWESEFQFLNPRKSKSGQRIYVKKDLELVLQIKDMLYRDRYTIEGVRKRFSELALPAATGKSAPSAPAVKEEALVSPKAVAASVVMESTQQSPAAPQKVIEHVKERIREIIKQLS